MKNKVMLTFLSIWLIAAVVIAGVLIYTRQNKNDTSASITSQTTNSPTNSSSSKSDSNSQQATATYSIQDVAKHNSTSDCWLIVSGNVYNVTDFITQHPGGQVIANYCGRNATQAFEGERSHRDGETDSSGNTASQELSKHLLGKLST